MKYSRFFRASFLIAILLMLSFVVATPFSVRAISLTATVRVDTLNVRRAPGVNFPVLGTLLRNDQITLVGRNAGASWLQASTKFGLGWVNAQFVSVSGGISGLPITDSTISPFVTVAAFPAIVVRSGPAVEFPPLGLLLTGTVADIIGQDAKGDWLQVPFDSGSGWIQAQFVTITGTTLFTPDSSDNATPVARSVVYRLRVRSAADLTSNVVGVMVQNEYATIIGTNARHTFWKVQGAFGTGWVAAEFVLATGNLGAVPVVG